MFIQNYLVKEKITRVFKEFINAIVLPPWGMIFSNCYDKLIYPESRQEALVSTLDCYSRTEVGPR